MMRKCVTCGNPAVDDISVFCNKCGARLPVPVVLTCKKCGETFTDHDTRFCNRCGTPLVEPPPLFSSLPAAREKTEAGTNIQKSRLPVTESRNKPENSETTMVKKPSRAVEQELPHRIKDGIPQKSPPRSYRKIAAAVAGIILVIIIIGVLAIYVPDFLHTGPENLTATGLASPTEQGAAVTVTPGSSVGNTKPPTPATQTPTIAQTATTQVPGINQTATTQTPAINQTPAIAPSGIAVTPATPSPGGVQVTPATQPPGSSVTPATQPPGSSVTPATKP